MLLREWRKSKGFTQLTLAQKLGVHQTTVASWEGGHKVPRQQQMLRIRQVTEGAVTAADFYDDSQKAAA